MEEKTKDTAAQQDGVQAPETEQPNAENPQAKPAPTPEMGEQAQRIQEKGKPPVHVNAVRELETCLGMSANILRYLTARPRNDYYRTNIIERAARHAIEKFVQNNITGYKTVNKADVFGGLIELNIGYFEDLRTDQQEVVARYTIKNEMGEDVEVERKFIYDRDPDVEMTEAEDALFAGVMAERHGDDPSLIKIVDGRSMFDLLQSPDLYTELFKRVSETYSGLSVVEKNWSTEWLVKIQNRLLQVNQNIMRGGASILDTDRKWFERISECINKYVNLTEQDSSIEERNSKKYRTLMLYMYLKAKTSEPDGDFTDKTAFYDFIASVIGTKRNSVKEYILALGQPGLDYHIAKRFEKVQGCLRDELKIQVPKLR